MNMNQIEKIILVAMTKDRLIGAQGDLPWHIPAEMQVFKRLTTGNTVIMGRNTFTSIGKPLPNRHNIVISQTLTPREGIMVCQTFEGGVQRALAYGRPIYFIGGATIYRLALPLADFLIISYIKQDYQGDTFFPEFNQNEWLLVKEEEYEEFAQLVLKRR